MTTTAPHIPAPAADEPIAFDPVVRTRTRHDGWTEQRQRAFIHHLARIGVVGAAAHAVGMTAKSAYRLRAAPGAASFAAAWDLAVDQGLDNAEAVFIDRALNGIRTPVFYQGKYVGDRLRYDVRLLVRAIAVGERRALAAMDQRMADLTGPARKGHMFRTDRP
jgi:hypothetical protein